MAFPVSAASGHLLPWDAHLAASAGHSTLQGQIMCLLTTSTLTFFGVSAAEAGHVSHACPLYMLVRGTDMTLLNAGHIGSRKHCWQTAGLPSLG